jgi:methylated-DNA-[protein]-cysteine S-methyltransferase
MVGGMRAARTEYAVAGWGVGELWTGDDVVLAHEFAFDADAGSRAGVAAARASRARGDVSPRPPKGAHGPPTGTVPGESAHLDHDFVPASEREGRGSGGGVGTPGDLDPGGLVKRFAAFFAGEDPGLGDVPVDLSWATPFQHAVALTLRGVPRGEVVSYGELAALAGYPGAARAAGTFCAHNRLMLLVPCHRVVGATGLGGYGSAGLGVKRRLLELEGVRL